MATFTAVGDNVTLQMNHKGDVADVDISGTYNMVIELQREVGSPGSGAWVKLKEWSTANATVAYKHVTEADNEKLRLIVTTDTSGTATATLADNTDTILEKRYDALGNVIEKRYEDGSIFYNVDGDVVADTRLSERFIVLTDANYTVLQANNGKTHIVPDVSADRTITLPSVQDGLYYRFVSKDVGADSHDWIFDTGSDTNFFLGGVTHLDADAGSAGDEIVPVDPDGDSNSKLQINAPNGGTVVEMYCDGTNWIVWGMVVSATAPAFADQ